MLRVSLPVLLSAILLPAVPLDASVIFGAPAGGPSTLHVQSPHTQIDIDGDGTYDLVIGAVAFDPPENGAIVSMNRTVGVYQYQNGSDLGAIALQVGDVVGPVSSSAYRYLYSAGLPNPLIVSAVITPGLDGWVAGQPAYIGIDLSSATHNYAWLQLSVTPVVASNSYDVTIYNWAYETQPNTPIAVPEPGFATLLGAVTLLGLCRRAC